MISWTIFYKHFMLFSAIGTVKTSRIPNHGSVVVSPTPRSVFSTWARRRPQWTISHYVCTWCPTSTSSLALRLWKQAVFAATSTSSRTAERISSTSAWGCIHSMSSESTKCYRALELIGKSRTLTYVCVSRNNLKRT